MSQVAATTFPCANCGAKLAYDAGSQAMACPYCGAKKAVADAAPTAAGASGVREISLDEGLRMAARGYGAPVTTISCKECGASVHVGEGERTTTCAFCGSSQVLPAEAGEPPIRPESLLPFRVSKEDANKRFGDWLGSRWLRPNDLKRIARVNEMGGVYVPFWTFDADVTSQWTGERGWYYYETETYTETVNGQQEERTREVQRTRWEPAYGMRRDRFEDVLVCAGSALPPELVDKLSTFDTKLLVAYRPEYLAGWRAESYAVELAPASGIAQQKMTRIQEGRCASDVGGNTHRNLSVANDYENTTFKHVLLPVWVAAYRYRGKVYRFVVNGQTGEVVGVAPWSAWKIALLVVAIVAIIGGIVAVSSATNGASSSAPAPPPAFEPTPAAPPPRLPPHSQPRQQPRP
jgi:DNA-directed RNA polymerase subunit RPC12/RpoP